MSANPLSLSWLMHCFPQVVYRFRRVEIDLSQSQLKDENGIVANACRTAKIL